MNIESLYIYWYVVFLLVKVEPVQKKWNKNKNKKNGDFTVPDLSPGTISFSNKQLKLFLCEYPFRSWGNNQEIYGDTAYKFKRGHLWN